MYSVCIIYFLSRSFLPDVVSFTGSDSIDDDNVTERFSDDVILNVAVHNLGPSTIYNTIVDIYVPYNTETYYYVYPASIVSFVASTK